MCVKMGFYEDKIQSEVKVHLTCDVIRKVTPFVLSKLWILVADWSMHWSPDTFLIKLRLLSLLHQNKTFQFFNAYYASELCVLTKNVNKVLPIPSLPECIICRRQLGYHSKNVDETFQNCQIIGQWLSDRNVKNGLLCMNVDFLCIK